MQGLLSDEMEAKSMENDEYYLRIYVHVLRDGNGDGGMTEEQVQTSLNILYDGFEQANIHFIRAEDEIDYIDNDDFFEHTWNPDISCQIANETDPNTGELIYSHDDGIDIFFDSPAKLTFVKPNGEIINLAGGRSIGVPGTNYFLWGEWDRGITQPTSTALTPSVIHEMGHCLGLYHTHHGVETGDMVGCSGTVSSNAQPENIVPYHVNNGLVSGDFVVDTYADPNLHFNVSPSTCQPSPPLTAHDDDDHYYTPLLDNYMAYSSLECMNKFTDGQIERMHNMIDMTQILTNCLIDMGTPPLVNQIITGIETWTMANAPYNDGINGIYLIKGNLTIADGGFLTVEDGVIVRFENENGCLIVKRGGKLTLNGTLSSKDALSSWQGVRVCGWPQYSQFGQNSWQFSEEQGQFFGISGTIENAVIGITNYNPINNKLTGGIVRCSDGMTFKNNRIAVDFNKYQNYYGTPIAENPRNDLSVFSNCHFITDDNYAISKQFYAFMRLKKIDGLTISGCDFTNAQTVAGDEIIDWGYGILAEDSKFIVNSWCSSGSSPCSASIPSTFNGLGEAISQKTIEYQRPYLVKEAVFNNCFIGIRNSLISTGNILFNQFNMGDLPAVNFEVQQYGVTFEGGTLDINCEENTFTGSGNNSNIDKIGIYCYRTGEANKQIRKNQFNNLTIGILVSNRNGNVPLLNNPEYISTGIVFLCNEFNNTLAQPDQLDIEIATGVANLIKYEQGLEVADNNNNITYSSAGNQFSNIGEDFIWNRATPINYYYNMDGNNELPLIPPVGNGNPDLFTPIQAAPNTCPTNYCEPPCKSKAEINTIKGGYFDHSGQVENLLNINAQNYSIETSNKLTYEQRLKDEKASTVIMHTLYDTTDFNLDTLKTWIDRRHNISGDLWLMRMAKGEGDFATAEYLLNQIPTKYNLLPEQITDLNNTGEILTLTEDKILSNLPLNTVSQLKTFDQVGGDAEVWTKNILSLYGYYYPPRYESAVKGKGNLPKSSKAAGHNYLTPHPNPAKEYVGFSFAKNDQGLLVIKNIGGKTVFEQTVLPDEIITWEVKNNASGIYFYQFISQGKILQSGKISIQK